MPLSPSPISKDDAAACSSTHASSEDPEVCRLCWGEHDDSNPESVLISPCSCKGSLQFIHCKCLYEWQCTLRNQGQFRRARACEICRATFIMTDPAMQKFLQSQGLAGALSSEPSLWRALSSAGKAIWEEWRRTPWPQLAFRLWRIWVLWQGLTNGVRSGVSGLSAGVKLGRSLVTEQAGVMSRLLASMAELIGRPYAGLFLGHAAFVVVFALASEFTYMAVLGGVGGALYGFITGYMGAVRGSGRLLVSGSTRTAGLLWLGLRSAVRLCGASLRHSAKQLSCVVSPGAGLRMI